MDAALRRLIRQRAGDRCEYCRLPQSAVKTTLQVEHIVARQHAGPSLADNLALACDRCNLHKGTNLSAIDPQTGQVVPVFDPRTNVWTNHFELVGAEIVGISPMGRATARLLHFNTPTRLRVRRLLVATGQW